MDREATKNVIEAALLAAGKPLAFDRLVEIFARKGVDVDRGELRGAIASLGEDYAGRGIELKEVASGFRIQVRSQIRDWLEPLFEERAPRYTRALLETLALVAYRQPITRAEIEEIRGVAVSSNIVRTLIERGWVRVVGHRDVPGKPSMLGTTREFLDYFGLKRLEDLPPLAELRDLEPGTNLQSDLIDRLAEGIQASAHADSDDSADLGVVPEPGAAAEPDVTTEPGATAEPGAIAEHGITAEPDATAEPGITADPDDSDVIASGTVEPEPVAAGPEGPDGESADGAAEDAQGDVDESATRLAESP